MDNEITLTLPLGMELEGLDLGRNLSALYGEGVQAGESTDPVAYEQFLADVWIGIVLTLMVLSCVCCMCSCLLYHKFQQWKRNGKFLFVQVSSRRVSVEIVAKTILCIQWKDRIVCKRVITMKLL